VSNAKLVSALRCEVPVDGPDAREIKALKLMATADPEALPREVLRQKARAEQAEGLLARIAELHRSPSLRQLEAISSARACLSNVGAIPNGPVEQARVWIDEAEAAIDASLRLRAGVYAPPGSAQPGGSVDAHE